MLQRFPLQLPEGQTVHLDFRDISAWYWLNHILGEKAEEAGLVEAVCEISKPGEVIWDVGANCGFFSYLVARRLPNCRLFFFEPNRFAFEIASAALRPFPHVSGMNIGLSLRKRDDGTLTIPAGESTLGSIQPKVPGRKNQTLPVLLDAGDRLVEEAGLPAPHVIKIDTEGHEAEVLAGLGRTILQHKTKVFFEHLGLTDQQVKNLLPPGYELFSISNLTGEIRRGLDRSVGHNLAIFPASSS